MPPTKEQAFELYLHDIHDLPLLAPVDEQHLVARLVAGRDVQRQRASGSEVSVDERHRLEQIIADGQRAREALIAAHLRLVIRIARQYTGRGVSLLDLVQEGNVGLMQAVDHFDPQHGVRFATYAVWWVRHAIAHALVEARHPVHLPDDVRAKLYRLYHARNDLLQHLGREPDEHDLAQAAGISVREVRDLLQYHQPVVSLNQPLADDGDNELADVVPDPAAELQLGAAFQAALAEELEQLLRYLNAEEREVLRLRFGLHGKPLRTRQDVAKQLGIRTEHVRQLEARALRKLRSSELIERLRDYVDQ
jgi:RNA polymerase sigma factor (sigma-70 family)